MRCARYGPVVLSDATHTADVRVVPVSVGTGYHLLLPLNGHSRAQLSGQASVIIDITHAKPSTHRPSL
jgi:hypothetical protein